MYECNSVRTPHLKEERPGQDQEVLLDTAKAATLRSCTTILMFMSQDRLDIQGLVNYLSQFISKPTEYDWRCLIRVVRYLRGTEDWGVFLLNRFD